MWAVRWLSHLDDLCFAKNNSAQDVMHEWAHGCDKAANHHLPIAAAFWIIWIVPRGMLKLNAKFDADLLLYSLSHFECDGHTVHMLTQWCLPSLLTNTAESSLFTHACVPVHSPWLPGYTDVVQTILLVLTKAGLSPDRPDTSSLWNGAEPI